MYITPSTTARSSIVRLLPPHFAGGIRGAMIAHSSSVRSLGQRSLLRSYFGRFSGVHMTGLLPARAIPGQSQPIQITRPVPGWTLSDDERGRLGDRAGDEGRKRPPRGLSGVDVRTEGPPVVMVGWGMVRPRGTVRRWSDSRGGRGGGAAQAVRRHKRCGVTSGAASGAGPGAALEARPE